MCSFATSSDQISLLEKEPLLSTRKLIPAVVVAVSLAPFAANARSYRAPLPPVSSVEQTYTMTAFSQGRAAERPYAQHANQNVSVAQQFMTAPPSNAAHDTSGG
jgi:hypothetical protein